MERKFYKCILIASIWTMGAIDVFVQRVNSMQLPVLSDRTAEAISHFPNRIIDYENKINMFLKELFLEDMSIFESIARNYSQKLIYIGRNLNI